MVEWRLGDLSLDLSPPVGAGIVNVTVDSMFEGARSGTPEQAIADGIGLARAGFDMLDVGAVAARSGPPVTAEDECAALLPAIAGLAPMHGPGLRRHLSVETARRALDAGAVCVNDISGGCDEMFELVAATGCGYVLMHIEGPPRVDRPWREYDDVVDHMVALVRGEGRSGCGSWVSPTSRSRSTRGSTSTSRPEQDLEMMRRLGELRALGLPLYVSLSRKDFIGAVLAGSWEERLPAGEREWGTVAAVTLAVRDGADILRIHDRVVPPGDAPAARSAAASPTRESRKVERPNARPGGRPPALAGRMLARSTQWGVAIAPARRDGRIVAEAAEPDRTAQPVPLPDRPRPEPGREVARWPGSSRSTRTSCAPGRRRRART